MEALAGVLILSCSLISIHLYASALAWILLAITLCVTLAQFHLSKRYVYYEGQK